MFIQLLTTRKTKEKISKLELKQKQQNLEIVLRNDEVWGRKTLEN